MGKHLDNVIELEYEQIIYAHPEELTPSQKASIRTRFAG